MSQITDHEARATGAKHKGLRPKFSRSPRLSCSVTPPRHEPTTPLGPAHCLLLRHSAANSHKFWKTRYMSMRMFEKCLLSAISTFVSDPDLNPSNEQRSSGWFFLTMKTLLNFNLHMPSPCAPFGPLHFPGPKIPGCDYGHLRSSNFVVGCRIRLHPLDLLAVVDFGVMYNFVRIVRCAGVDSFTGQIAARTPASLRWT